METLRFTHTTKARLPGTERQALVGVVGSGNLEVLLERVLPDDRFEITIDTAIRGYGEVWEAVVADFVERRSPGGVRISINDGGARPDTVSLRLAQGARMLETTA